MWDADPVTFEGLKRLWGLADRKGRKPVVVWVGAGASSWLGYERWPEVAERFHGAFVRNASSTYSAEEGVRALKAGDYPCLFQSCFDASPELYRSMLSESFQPRPLRPVHLRFVQAISRIDGASVVTTNVDEMLERTLSGFQTVQRSNLSRVTELIASGGRFIGKLHGSISAVETAVFKASDYRALENDPSFVGCLRHLVSACCVVFIGYGLRGKYVIELLSASAEIHSLFGDGPHFLIAPDAHVELPRSVHPIRYRTELHTDHRSSILAVELIGRSHGEIAAFEYGHPAHPSDGEVRSAHLLSDFYPGGTWETGQTVSLRRSEDGTMMEAVTGPGWVRGEMPRTATAAHDLMVGLLCFDQVLVPINCIGRVFDILGEQRFRALLSDGVLRFVHWEGLDLVMFPADDPGFGGLATGRIGGQEAPAAIIKRQMTPVPGREKEAAELIAEAEGGAISIDLSGTRNFADICAGLFCSPATRRLLGMSEGTPAGNIPRWLAHPVLRLVQIARIGATCQQLALGSMKLMAGASRLAGVAFSAIAGGVLASEAANYVLTGQFGTIPDSVFSENPGLWDCLLQFRETGSGVDFRREIFTLLLRNEGAEILPAVDSSLRCLLPPHILDAARRDFSALLLSPIPRSVVPAIWSDAALLADGAKAWRAVAKTRLLEFMRAHNVDGCGDCPCGSHERLRFCCLPALEPS